LIMAVAKSPRPKGRPGNATEAEDAVVAEATAAAVDDAAAIAMQESIAGALAEATTPPPSGTLEAQSIALVDEPSVPQTTDPTAEIGVVDLALQDTSAAATLPIVADAQSETQASAQTQLSGGAAGTVAVDSTELAANEIASVDAAPAIIVPLAAQNAPPPRPAQPPVEVELADASAPSADTVIPFAIEDTSASAQSLPIDQAIDPSAEPATIALAANVLRPAKRNAPIFEDAVNDTSNQTATEQVVVTRVSTSGGRYWGVNVGRFSSSYEAESALLKTQLTESATLNDGLRKVIKKAGQFDANFMGLSQEQADLACRRLQARAVQCFTIGP
jgi:D-alanyl-D-alanine carboxypeptidase